MRKTRLFAVTAAVLLVLYAVAAPWITVYRIKLAADRQDEATLSRLIAFPAVRASLKQQVNGHLTQAFARQAGQNPWAALGALFAGTVADTAVEAYVTPAGIARLLTGQASGSAGDGTALADHQTRLAYESANRFVVTVEDASGQVVRLVLQRHGLGWQLTDILLPLPA